MDKLDDSARETLSSLQKKIDECQRDPDLCAELTLNQCTLLAELQAIYNILSNKTSSNVPSIYNNTCKGIQDQMKQPLESYANHDAQALYQKYVETYERAKKTLERL